MRLFECDTDEDAAEHQNTLYYIEMTLDGGCLGVIDVRLVSESTSGHSSNTFLHCANHFEFPERKKWG